MDFITNNCASSSNHHKGMLTLTYATVSFPMHHFQPRRVRHVVFVHVSVLKEMLFVVVRPDGFRATEAFNLFLSEKQTMGHIHV